MAVTQVTQILGSGISMQTTYDSLTNVISSVKFTAANALSSFTASVTDVDSTVLASSVSVTAVSPCAVTPSGSAVAVFHPLFRQFFPRSDVVFTVTGSGRTIQVVLA